MRVLVTGARGQLGVDLCRELSARGHFVIEADIHNMDITDGEAVERFISENAPEAVIHCAAYTATDKAEDETDEPTEPEVTDPPLKEKSGCGSSFSALGVLLSCIAGAALVFRKRK